MPFTLTFDANQEASARKYYARVNPVQPLNPPVVSECPQVKPPKCPSGQKLITTYGEPPCRTPNYSCQPENDPLAWCRSSFDVNRCSGWWTKNGCVVNMSANGTGTVSCPSRPAVDNTPCPMAMPIPCPPNQKLVTTYGTDRCRTPRFRCEPLIGGIGNDLFGGSGGAIPIGGGAFRGGGGGVMQNYFSLPR